MPYVHINWWAVIIAAIINIVLGSLWYSKRWFGKDWAKLTGHKFEEMRGSTTGYLVATVGAFIQVWIMAHFVIYAGSTTFWKGLVTGFWLWLAFIAVVAATQLIFEGRSWMLWRINTGYLLVVLLFNGGLLAAWR